MVNDHDEVKTSDNHDFRLDELENDGRASSRLRRVYEMKGRESEKEKATMT